jgi:hypothetical protein
VLASAAGGALGVALGLKVGSHDLPAPAASRAVDEVIIYGLYWMGIGAGQWLVLRRCIARAGWWVVASALGGALVGLAAGTLGNPPPVPVYAAYGLLGLLLGVPQWMILRRHVRRAAWWLMANSAGWALGTLAAVALDRAMTIRVSEIAGLVLLFGVASGIAGSVTGALLVWLPSQAPTSRRVSELA